MRSTALVFASVCLLCAVLWLSPASASPLSAPVSISSREDETLWGSATEKQKLLQSIDHSLRYLRTGAAASAYARQQSQTGITRERVRRSLVRFRHLLKTCRTPAELDAALQREFVTVSPSGSAPVHFTGYFEPVYAASRVRTATCRYPLYRMPAGLPRPHPTREELEGPDGLPAPGSLLRGKEIVYLADRLEAFLVQVQGSARLRLPDGRMIHVHNDGHTDHPYTSIGRQLVNDGKIAEEELTLPAVMEWFREHPEELSDYIPRNRRFVFFQEGRDTGRPPLGSIGSPLTAERSIATDKRLHPPGVLALIRFELVNPNAAEVFGHSTVTRFVLDQDTGSAIKGPARVDVYMGSGPRPGQRAGVMNSMGSLTYLLLKKP